MKGRDGNEMGRGTKRSVPNASSSAAAASEGKPKATLAGKGSTAEDSVVGAWSFGPLEILVDAVPRERSMCGSFENQNQRKWPVVSHDRIHGHSGLGGGAGPVAPVDQAVQGECHLRSRIGRPVSKTVSW